MGKNGIKRKEKQKKMFTRKIKDVKIGEREHKTITINYSGDATEDIEKLMIDIVRGINLGITRAKDIGTIIKHKIEVVQLSGLGGDYINLVKAGNIINILCKEVDKTIVAKVLNDYAVMAKQLHGAEIDFPIMYVGYIDKRAKDIYEAIYDTKISGTIENQDTDIPKSKLELLRDIYIAAVFYNPTKNIRRRIKSKATTDILGAYAGVLNNDLNFSIERLKLRLSRVFKLAELAYPLHGIEKDANDSKRLHDELSCCKSIIQDKTMSNGMRRSSLEILTKEDMEICKLNNGTSNADERINARISNKLEELILMGKVTAPEAKLYINKRNRIGLSGEEIIGLGLSGYRSRIIGN